VLFLKIDTFISPGLRRMPVPNAHEPFPTKILVFPLQAHKNVAIRSPAYNATTLPTAATRAIIIKVNLCAVRAGETAPRVRCIIQGIYVRVFKDHDPKRA
jgi:hypothetical protein